MNVLHVSTKVQWESFGPETPGQPQPCPLFSRFTSTLTSPPKTSTYNISRSSNHLRTWHYRNREIRWNIIDTPEVSISKPGTLAEICFLTLDVLSSLYNDLVRPSRLSLHRCRPTLRVPLVHCPKRPHRPRAIHQGLPTQPNRLP